jgi:hypothetical protein
MRRTVAGVSDAGLNLALEFGVKDRPQLDFIVVSPIIP